MMTGCLKYLLVVVKSECFLKSKKSDCNGSWNGDLLKLCPEAAIEKFLTKRRVLQKLLCKVAVLHLCSALLACFSRF